MPATLLLYAGGAAVPLAGLWMTWRAGGREGLRALGRSAIDVRRIPARWWAFILLFVPLLHAATLLVARLAGLDPGPVAIASAHEGDPLGFLLFAAFILFLGPVPEEIGWRGYALGALMERFPAAAASLLLGIAWAAWHVPLFFIQGYYAPFGGPPDPIPFFGAIVASSVLYTWIWRNTGRSLLAAILFHFMVNFTGELLPLGAELEALRALLLGAFAALLLAFRPTLRGGRG
ncbi:MAG: lysostaphin resistance A-like protein [Allosphingosinicella sp.]